MSGNSVVCAVAVLLVAGVGYLVWMDWRQQVAGPPGTHEPDVREMDRLAEEGAKSLIAAESRLIDVADGQTQGAENPPAMAPPGFEPSPLPASEPVPPAGYAFVASHEVEWGRMTAADVERAPSTPPAWMASGVADLLAQTEAAGRDWTYGWVQLAEDDGAEALQSVLEVEGGEVLGQSGPIVRARLPGDAAQLQAIAAAAPVAGVGTWPVQQKILGDLPERALANAHDEAPVWITLMDGDPDRRWRRALVNKGAEVGHFDPAIRTYAATLPLGVLEQVARADYVLAIEPIGRLEPALEFMTSVMGADGVRVYDESKGLFSGVGGASVPVGIMDTGFNLNHADLSSNRRSICGLNFVKDTDYGEADEVMWYDSNGHGSYVSGVLLGNGAVNRSRAGLAPLVQDIRVARVVGDYSSALAWGRAMDWFATPTDCGEGTARKALVINASVGFRSNIWGGRSVVERKIDASVSTARQLFVVAVGNAGDDAFISTAGAKNGLAVGATEHHGDIAAFSGRGPTYDGRLFPKVVALGSSVATTRGAAWGVDYGRVGGTSIASPAVAGVAAMVMDAAPGLREEPAAVRALLMARAIKPETLLADPDGFRAHNTDGPGRMQNIYGLGMVSARTAVLDRDGEDGWTGGAAGFDMEVGDYAYYDVEVPPGASRLDVVLTWDEPAAELVNDAVLHDLDLWVDRDVECGEAAACGQYRSRSRRDNVEWVIVRNPPPGTYRVKALPNRIFGAAPRAGLAWTVVRGHSMPSLAVAVEEAEIEVAPDEPFDVSVTVSSDGYVASGTVLRVDCRAPDTSGACDLAVVAGADSRTTREDGREVSLGRNLNLGIGVYALGELGPDEEQTVTFRMIGRREGSVRMHFTAMGWNAAFDSASVDVAVGDPPGDPPTPASRPANDDFAAAMRLEGPEGQTGVDLLHATAEVGEPDLSPFPYLPGPRRTGVRTVWFSWTALDAGLVRFTLPQRLRNDYSPSVVLDVYEGDALTGLVRVGVPRAGGGTTFFAEAGARYRIRLGIDTFALAQGALSPGRFGVGTRQRPTPVLALSWAPAVRPANDDFALAAVIEGASGWVEGNNQAATIEPGELMGFADHRRLRALWPSKAASVWYRWTAPSSGDWRFSEHGTFTVVSVYTGGSVAETRLVSGAPGRPAVFPAQEGQEYRISVAATDAYASGGDFGLSWGPYFRRNPRNDDFANAQSVTGGVAYSFARLNDLTVEPGEPPESGARTFWFDWDSPGDGRYVWRAWAGSRTFSTMGQGPLQISVFEGEELASLRPVAVDDATDQTMFPDIVLDAEADTPYRLAVGLPRDAAEMIIGSHVIVMEVGEVPANDDLVNAAALSGTSGSAMGSNRFATLETGEFSGALGDSSLWWSYAVAESGWTRFATDRRDTKIAVYRRDEYGELELVGASRPIGATDPVVAFHARAGVEYFIRVGAYIHDREGRRGTGLGDFEISWRPGAPPARVRYVHGIDEGDNAADGSPIIFGRVGAQALNADGSEHYLASDLGLMVFARDTKTGRLTPRQTLDGYPVGDAQLLWDEAGEALLVAQCGDWWRFTARQGGGLEHAGVLGGAPCPGGRVILHESHLIHVDSSNALETYAFGDDHATVSLMDRFAIAGVADAVLTADGANAYALTRHGTENTLYALTRDTETGALTLTTTIGSGTDTGDGAVVPELTEVVGMAVGGSHLFLTLGSGGTDTLVFDLADRAYPAFSQALPSFVDPTSGADCRHLSLRSNTNVLDVFCSRFAHYYSVQVGPDGALLPEEYLRLRYERDADLPLHTDSFGNPLMRWTGGAIASVGTSPDGRHLYVAGSRVSREQIFSLENGLHVFERVYGTED
ncbi:MAG: S8 family serine peptidase [Gammaproteobacteria bacterium]|nr:S8 family serine peptidase [Gammaproteobacteria bacterium]